MAINPTQSNFKSFTFGGTNSRSYGVYITGQGVFNAPERNVEMIEIPGRNGAYALDKGNFNNIEVTYPAGIFADNATDFATAVSDLRNLLCSKVGYVRLEDDYNPNEYRLAIYKSGLEVSHDMLIAGEFDITFECKPQRYLTSGETAVAVASGGTLTNPTLFESHPQLRVEGSGSMDINGGTIVVNNQYIGEIVVANGHTSQNKDSNNWLTRYTFDYAYANNGDSLRLSNITVTELRHWFKQYDYGTFAATATNNGIVTASVVGQSSGVTQTELKLTLPELNAVFGTQSEEDTTATYTINFNGSTKTGTVYLKAKYNGSNYFTLTTTRSVPASPNSVSKSYSIKAGDVILDSTDYILGNPTYIDLDIGECYKIENGSTVSVNNGIELPAELPTLKSGSNTITYDNTFTSFKVVPRWWKV